VAGFVIILGLAFVGGGVLMWIHREKISNAFGGAGSSLFGEKAADVIYTPGNFKWTAGGTVFLGLVFLVVGTISTIHYYTH
jgi:hypothetical protein